MIDRDDLKKEHEENEALENSFSRNPVKRAIQELFHNEFHAKEYKKYTLQDAKNLVSERIKASIEKPGMYSSSAFNLSSKIKKSKTVEDILFILNEYLFS